MALRAQHRQDKGQPALLMALLGIALIACERYEPSSEPGISLPRFERVADAREKRVLFYSLSGSGKSGKWSGLYVDTEGNVWEYGRDSAGSGGTRCADFTGSRFLQCVAEGAKLVARVDQAAMRDLTEHLRTISERDREDADGGWRDGGFTGLIVTGLGTKAGTPIEIGTCGGPKKTYSQLTTKEAEHVIDLYWRLLRGVYKWPKTPLCAGLQTVELRNGVLGWWMPR